MLSKDQTLGKYQILDRLGSGGFGAVYLAMDTWVNRKVALKVPHQQQEEIVDLLKEPRIMAGLKHPNIVELITVERKNGIFFMVLEYVEGEGLDRLIRRERALPPTRALEIGLDVCCAQRLDRRLQRLLYLRLDTRSSTATCAPPTSW